MKHFLIIARQAPYGSAAAREALELALACALFDQPVSLLLLDDACFQLLPEHKPAAIQQKNLAAMQQSLPLYDVDKIYVCTRSMHQRGLHPESLSLEVVPLDAAGMKKLIREHEVVINV